MPSSSHAAFDPVIPTPELTQTSRNLLHDMPKDRVGFGLTNPKTGENIELPPEVCTIICEVLTALSQNQAVTVMPTDMELTTNQAAEILNVSRGFVIKLIDEHKMPARMVGSHRRVRLQDALNYRDAMKTYADKALDELAQLDSELGLDD